MTETTPPLPGLSLVNVLGNALQRVGEVLLGRLVTQLLRHLVGLAAGTVKVLNLFDIKVFKGVHSRLPFVSTPGEQIVPAKVSTWAGVDAEGPIIAADGAGRMPPERQDQAAAFCRLIHSRSLTQERALKKFTGGLPARTLSLSWGFD